MKLVTFAIDTPAGELRRVGAIRKKDGFSWTWPPAVRPC